MRGVPRPKWLVVALVSLVMGGGIPAAVAHHSLSVSHSPAASAVAGDPVTVTASVTTSCLAIECGDITVAVEYRDSFGDVKSITKVLPLEYFAMSASSSSTTSSPGSSTRSVSFELPGEAVKFPEFNYKMRASQNSNNPLNPHEAVAVSPASGDHSVAVDPELRLRFLKADGTPLANTTVHWFPLFDAGAVWTVATSATGHAAFRLPTTDAKVLQALQAPARRNLSVAIHVLEHWPEAVPPGGETIVVNAAFLNTTFDLGYPGLPALTGDVQDSTIVIEPQRLSFGQIDGIIPDPGGPTHGYNEVDSWVEAVKAAKNVGGDKDFKSEFWYRHSVNTTFTVQTNFGEGWEAKGEITSFENKQNSAGPWIVDASTGRKNVDALVDWRFGLWEGFACGYTGNGTCYTWHDVKPKWWTTGTDESGEYNSLHGMATAPPNTTDCTVRSEVPHESSDEKGTRITVSLGGSSRFTSIPMGARTKYSTESSVLVKHRWAVVGNTYQYHHRFVLLGLAIEGETLCPRSHPSETYTDSADVNKSYGG